MHTDLQFLDNIGRPGDLLSLEKERRVGPLSPPCEETDGDVLKVSDPHGWTSGRRAHVKSLNPGAVDTEGIVVVIDEIFRIFVNVWCHGGLQTECDVSG